MYSAFGVDHGYDEISKLGLGGAFTGLGARIGGGVERYGSNVRRIGAQQMGTARKAGSAISPQQAHGLKVGGAANVRSGGKIRSVGQAMQRRPGLTGGLAAGGAAAGIGGGAAAIGNRRRY